MVLALGLPAPASAAEPVYPPPAFGGGGTTVSTPYEAPTLQRAPAALPFTGADLRPLMAAAGLGIAAGGLMLVLARRPRVE